MVYLTLYEKAKLILGQADGQIEAQYTLEQLFGCFRQIGHINPQALLEHIKGIHIPNPSFRG